MVGYLCATRPAATCEQGGPATDLGSEDLVEAISVDAAQYALAVLHDSRIDLDLDRGGRNLF